MVKNCHVKEGKRAEDKLEGTDQERAETVCCMEHDFLWNWEQT